MIYRPCIHCGQRVKKAKGRGCVCIWCERQRQRDQAYKAYWENPRKYRLAAKKKRQKPSYGIYKRYQNRKYYLTHKEEVSARRKEYYQKNKKHILAVQRKRRRLNGIGKRNRRVYPHGLVWGKRLTERRTFDEGTFRTK